MISVWGKFYPGTANFDAMQKAGYLYQPNLDEKMKDWIGFPYTFYDAFNPGARQMFWSQVDKRLFQKRHRRLVDGRHRAGPHAFAAHPRRTAKSHAEDRHGNRVARAQRLRAVITAKACTIGQRSAAPNQRVFILTRSGFAGSAALCHGHLVGRHYFHLDGDGEADSRRARTSAFPAYPIGRRTWAATPCRSGFPPRTTKPEDDEEWRELNARWFEFGTFTPLLRVHGEVARRAKCGHGRRFASGLQGAS